MVRKERESTYGTFLGKERDERDERDAVLVNGMSGNFWSNNTLILNGLSVKGEDFPHLLMHQYISSHSVKPAEISLAASTSTPLFVIPTPQQH